jgi:uncharacterized protein
MSPDLLHYWFLLPAGIAIATLVMSAGVSGATLWVPVYLLWLGLDAQLAFWLGLLTMLFGFGSGVYRNWRDGTYDAAMVGRFSAASVPAALAGAWLSAYLDQALLVAAFGAFLLVYGAVIGARALGMTHESARHDSVPYALALAGGFITGLISIGVGILAMPAVLRHRVSRSPAIAIGTLVMVIFLTSLAATAGRMRPAFVAALARDLPQLAAILLWAVPAVIVGGQVGPRIARALPSERHARLYFSAVLLVVGLLTLLRASAAR